MADKKNLNDKSKDVINEAELDQVTGGNATETATTEGKKTLPKIMEKLPGSYVEAQGENTWLSYDTCTSVIRPHSQEGTESPAGDKPAGQ